MSVQTAPPTPSADSAHRASAAGHTPGVPVIADGELISTSPATGAEVGRFPVADAEEVGAAVGRARAAGEWWRELGFDGRRERLLRWRAP